MDKAAPGLEEVIDCGYAHLLKSEGERQIASFLERCGIRYMYEAPVVVTQNGKQRIWYPDFLLPDLGLYIEYFGMTGLPEYDQGVQEKTKAYANAGLQVIYVYPKHLHEPLPGYLASEIGRVTYNRAQLAEQNLRVPASRSLLQHVSIPGARIATGDGRGYR